MCIMSCVRLVFTLVHLLYVIVHVCVCICVCVCARARVRTVQSTMVMCLAAVLASTSASSSLTLFSTDISRGLFSAGIRQDSYLCGSDYNALENTELEREHRQGPHEKKSAAKIDKLQQNVSDSLAAKFMTASSCSYSGRLIFNTDIKIWNE